MVMTFGTVVPVQLSASKLEIFQVRFADVSLASPLRIPTPEQTFEPLPGISNDIYPSRIPGYANTLIAPSQRASGGFVFQEPSTQSGLA